MAGVMLALAEAMLALVGASKKYGIKNAQWSALAWRALCQR